MINLYPSKKPYKQQSKMLCRDILTNPINKDRNNLFTWRMPQPDLFDLNTVSHLAVDWASHNWYFLDDTRELVLLCGLKYDPKHFRCKIILIFNNFCTKLQPF